MNSFAPAQAQAPDYFDRPLSFEDLEELKRDHPEVYAEYWQAVEVSLPVSSQASARINSLTPQEGPQHQAYFSDADVLLYGGAAGGGKSFLSVMLALKEHRRTLYIRREAAQLQAVKDEVIDILGHREGFNNQAGVWNLPPDGDFPERQLRFGGIAQAGDETKYQGAPRDLLIVDEAANCLESQVRFLMGWVRSTVPGQRCRTLLCSNPPTDATGLWLIAMFAPWLDKDHPLPAKPGELRFFATIDGVDTEVPSMDPIEDPNDPDVPILPQSRTFIPARVTDNKYLIHTGYVSVLQALPEPLRSQMLYGDFTAGQEDDAYQVIPTAWVQKAQQRWRKPRPHGSGPHVNDGDIMTGMGVDPSRGGRDESILAPKWESLEGEIIIDELIGIAGQAVPDGPTLGGHVLAHRRDQCPVQVDAIGVGTSVVDFLSGQGIHVEAITGSEKATRRDRTGVFRFRNQRTELYWNLREALDPANDPVLALPPDKKMLADLCAPTYKILEGNLLAVESKESISQRLGRSTDRGDAVVYATADREPRDGARSKLKGRRVRPGTTEHMDALALARRPGERRYGRTTMRPPRL